MGKIRTAAAAALTGALLLSGLVAAPAATAATDTKPSIAKIKTVAAPYGKKATIKPKVKRPAGVKVLSKTLTVKQGKKTIAKNRKAVKLAAGKYRVSTKVKYRTSKSVSTTRTVTRTTVGVEAWSSTPVLCIARAVEEYAWGAILSADCTGAAFDGTRKLVDLSVFGDTGAYTGYAANYDSLDFQTLPAVGERFDATFGPTADLYKTRQVSETSVRKVWSKTKVKTRTQTLIVKAGKRPSRTSPNSWGECPKWAPVKGNQGSYDWIYHVPGSTYYSRTDAEECFVSAAAAKRAGYRAPLR